ncbi:MAG TPA: TetR/AcrR family transcriptional regulator [Micromonosporaceae bacterium]|nr:TetR/AcrR family transcriptional regulator [Micromonosporaceae bacterium]
MESADPRTRRTRESLRAAALDLAVERELSDITMSQVAQRAGVNRATVYLHYPDLDALLADAMEEAAARLAYAAAICPLAAPREVAPQPLVDLFEQVAADGVRYRRMLGPQGSPRCAARIRDRFAAELRRRFEQGARPSGFDDVPIDVHAAYLAGAITGVITHWITSDPPAPAADVALATWRLFRN